MKKKIILGLSATLMSVALLAGCNKDQKSSTSVTSGGPSTEPTSIPVPSTVPSPEEQQAIADAKRVTDLINALTDSSTEAQVLSALSAYNALSELAKSKITSETKAKLDAKVEEIRKRKEDLKIQEVIAAIDELNDSSTKEKVLEVEALYNALTPELQARVTNKDELLKQVKRVREAAAIAMGKVIDTLSDPDDILLMDPSLLTQKYFEFTSVKNQYELLTEEDLTYLDTEKKQKYLSYAEELDKSVEIVIDGSTYRDGLDWDNTLPTGGEEYPTWLFSSIKAESTQQVIYAQKNLYETEYRAYGFMVKPTEECVLNYYSHMAKETYEAQGHMVVDQNLVANEWTSVSTSLEPIEPLDEQELSCFILNKEEYWDLSSSVEITSIVGIRKRTEETDQRTAAIVEAEINALNDHSTKEEIDAVISHYRSLSNAAKALISKQAFDKLISYIVGDVIAAIDSLNDTSTKERVLEVKALYDELDETAKGYVTNVAKLNAQLERIYRADAQAFELAVSPLENPEDILMMDPSILTEAYFNFTSVKKLYESLSDEALTYVTPSILNKYNDYSSELDKSVYVVLDGSKYRGYSSSLGRTDWDNPMPPGSEEFATWITPSINTSTNQQQIYAQQALYLTDTRAIGFMVKPAEDCVVNYYSHMDKSYNSEGHIVSDVNLVANQWNTVASVAETPIPSDDMELSRFDFDGVQAWSESSSIEITSIIGIRKRTEETDKHNAAIVEAEINALTTTSTKEDVTNVMNHYLQLTDGAKAYVSAKATEKLGQYISTYIITDIDAMIANTPVAPRSSSYFADYYKMKEVIEKVSGLPEAARTLIDDLEKYGQILNSFNSIEKYFDASSLMFEGTWEYGETLVKNINSETDGNVGFINKISVNSTGVESSFHEFSLVSKVTEGDYSNKDSIALAIYNPLATVADVTIHGGYGAGGWAAGGTHALAPQQWTVVQFDKEAFASGSETEIGKLYFIFSTKDVTIRPDGDWLISSVLDYNVLTYHRGTFSNGVGTIEYWEDPKTHDAWADEEKTVYVGNTQSDRHLIDISGEFGIQNNWDKTLINPIYDETNGYFFRADLSSLEKDGYNAIETVDSKFTFESKGYTTCLVTVTNNTSSSIRVELFKRAWGDGSCEIKTIMPGESDTFVINQEIWDAQESGGDYGFALLCYNLEAQEAGGTIDVRALLS